MISGAERGLRDKVGQWLDPAAQGSVGRRVAQGLVAAIGAGVIGVVLVTDPAWHRLGADLVTSALAVFVAEFVLRLWSAPAAERRRWLGSFDGVIDLAAAAILPLAWALGVDDNDLTLFGLIWIFKLVRYTPGLGMLVRVIEHERESLLGVLLAFLLILFCAAILGYLLERDGQPEAFGTIPRSLWWTIVTLTTTGYGDAIPKTPLGHILAGMVMVCGIMVFALWAGILATGYAQEMQRRRFLKVWDLVARVPLFHHVGAAVIAEVAHRLKTREVPAGSVVIRRNQPGDCMYFIVSGELEVQLAPRPTLLRDGDFFGEIALVTGKPRTATVVARRRATLLKLDIVDFRELVARHGELKQAIQLEAERRLELGRETTVARPRAGIGEVGAGERLPQ